FQRFSPEGFTNLLFALSYLFYALFQKISFSPQTWVWLLWAILLSWWGRTIIVVFFSTIEFYILNSELSRFFSEVYMSIEDRPLDIFPKRLRAFFIYILPVGLLSYIPACMLLGRIAWQTCLGFTLWLFFLGCLIFKFWNYSFRRYESALG
ncbi:MAG: ABC-2 family transporter protein, partial [Planctomycetota bacterium]